MRNIIKNKIKDRLKYCVEWENAINIYFANQEILKKANDKYYDSRPILKLLLEIYFIPTSLVKFLKYLRITHEYKKNKIEIEVLKKELNDVTNKDIKYEIK